MDGVPSSSLCAMLGLCPNLLSVAVIECYDPKQDGVSGGVDGVGDFHYTSTAQSIPEGSQ